MHEQNERMKAIKTAQEDMSVITAEARIKEALKFKMSPSWHYNIKPVDLVRVFREAAKKWLGPVEFIKVKLKLVHVSNGVTAKPFNLSKVIPVRIKND